jgi:hypothetical protein
MYRGAVRVNSKSEALRVPTFVLTSNSRNMTLVHEGWMSHGSYTADAVLRQLLTYKATTPARQD